MDTGTLEDIKTNGALVVDSILTQKGIDLNLLLDSEINSLGRIETLRDGTKVGVYDNDQELGFELPLKMTFYSYDRENKKAWFYFQNGFRIAVNSHISRRVETENSTAILIPKDDLESSKIIMYPPGAEEVMELENKAEELSTLELAAIKDDIAIGSRVTLKAGERILQGYATKKLETGIIVSKSNGEDKNPLDTFFIPIEKIQEWQSQGILSVEASEA